MAKLRTTKVFDVSKYLETKAGVELKDALEYLAEFTNEIITNLTNSLNYADNFASELKSVSVKNNVETVVKTGGRRVSEVRILQAVDNIYYVVDKFGWKYNSQGNVVIKATFDGLIDPLYTVNLNIIFYFL